MRTKMILLLVVTTLLIGATAQAQIMFGKPAAGDIEFYFSSWELTEDGTTTEITQSVVPMRGFVPLGENMEGLIYVAASGSQVVRGTVIDHSLNGISDVRMQVSRSLANDQFLISVGLNLPTGKTELTLDEEVTVLNYLAKNYIELPVRRLGEGLGFSVLVGTARMIGDWRAGGSISYRYSGSYAPYAGVTDFNPGDKISLNVGVDRQMEATALSFDITYGMYGTDQWDGDDIYEQSTELGLRAGFNWNKDVNHIGVAVGYLARGRNTIYVTDPSQDDATEAQEAKVYGNEFYGRASWGRDVAQVWRITPSVEFRSIAENESLVEDEQNMGSATIIGLGTTVARKLSDQVGFDIGGRYFTGDADGGNIDLTGYQVRLGLTANF